MNNKSLELANLIDGFRLSCQTEGKSPKTIDWYICFLNKFGQFLEQNQMLSYVGEIDKTHIRAFIRYLQTNARIPRGDTLLSPATVQGYVRTLKAFFSWLEREGYIASNPMGKIPIPKAPTKIISTFTTDQIAKLAAVCQSTSGNGYRNLSILLLMLDSGIRVSEVASINVGDVNIAEGCIKITGAKGGKERFVPIGNLVQKSLWKYINYFRPQSLTPQVTKLFLNEKQLPLTKNGIQQMFRRSGKRAGLSDVRVSPHTCRHTFAKNYLLNGGDVFSLQRILGHSSLASVRLYLNLFATDIKRQHQRFSPVDNFAAAPEMSPIIRYPGKPHKEKRGLLDKSVFPYCKEPF
jgi:integrase/recombinase XerD